MNIRGIGNAALDLLYPPSLYCHCCGNIIDESRIYNLCDHCIRHIRWDTGPVRRIGELKVLRCAQYGLYERTLIFSLKYNGNKYIARDIAEMAADRLQLSGVKFDVIVPVPMYRGKEKSRGFNQTALIGKYLAELTETRQYAHGLIRVADTLPMRALSPMERRQNVKGKFMLNAAFEDKIRGKKVLLLDDFFTTGSTAAECTEQLRKGGPEDILFISFAAKY